MCEHRTEYYRIDISKFGEILMILHQNTAFDIYYISKQKAFALVHVNRLVYSLSVFISKFDYRQRLEILIFLNFCL